MGLLCSGTKRWGGPTQRMNFAAREHVGPNRECGHIAQQLLRWQYGQL